MASVAAGAAAEGGGGAAAAPAFEFLTDFEVFKLMEARVTQDPQPADKSPELRWIEAKVHDYFRGTKVSGLTSARITAFVTALRAAEEGLGLTFSPGEILHCVNHVPSSATQLQAMMDSSRNVDDAGDILTTDQEDVILGLVREHLLLPSP